MMICHNRACINHQPMPANLPDYAAEVMVVHGEEYKLSVDGHTQLLGGLITRLVKRFPYGHARFGFLRVTFYFCESCHHAVEIVEGLKNGQ